MSFAVPNSLALPANAMLGGEAASLADLKSHQQRAAEEGLKFVVLGEGSNVVVSEKVNAFVCLNRIRGIELIGSELAPRIKVGAGENWHEFVLFCTRSGYYGLENLALIPGSVGAAPIQNIGAYGVEVASFIETVEVMDRNGELIELDGEACEFSYRDSLFKRRPELTVVSVTFALASEFSPILTYPDVVERYGNQTDAYALVQTVIDIRQAKLPNPAEVPNAGSFFKNPVVSPEMLTELHNANPELKSFPDPVGWKLSAAQLIDLAGWKAKPDATVACWQKQPLVLINLGGATSSEVLAFAEKIQSDVAQRFQVQLELEPSLLS